MVQSWWCQYIIVYSYYNRLFFDPQEALRSLSQDTSMRIVLGGADSLHFGMVSSDGEELCRGKLVETSEGQTLELESEEGTETWRKMPGLAEWFFWCFWLL